VAEPRQPHDVPSRRARRRRSRQREHRREVRWRHDDPFYDEPYDPDRVTERIAEHDAAQAELDAAYDPDAGRTILHDEYGDPYEWRFTHWLVDTLRPYGQILIAAGLAAVVIIAVTTHPLNAMLAAGIGIATWLQAKTNNPEGP